MLYGTETTCDAIYLPLDSNSLAKQLLAPRALGTLDASHAMKIKSALQMCNNPVF